MADNFAVEPVAGVPTKTFASDEIGGVDWPFAKLAFGPRDTASEVDDAETKRLPVKMGDGLGAASVVAGQISLSGAEAALTTISARRFRLKASTDNTDTIYLGPSGVTTADGFPLWPGDTYIVELSNLNVLHAIVGGGTQILCYLGEV